MYSTLLSFAEHGQFIAFDTPARPAGGSWLTNSLCLAAAASVCQSQTKHILYSFVMMTWIVKDTLKSFSCYTSSNAIWDWSNSNEGLFRNTVYPHLITLGNTVDNINGGNLAPHFLMDPWFNCKHWKLQQNHHCLFNDALHQIWNTSCGSVGKLDMKKQ